MLPGVEEVLALLAVRELAAAGDWDALVVDCAPTAETLRLLALPEALGWYLQKVFPAHRRIAKGIRPIASLLGRGEVIPPDNIFEALLRLNDDLAAVRQLLGDPAITTVRLVLTPESVVAAEARRTFTALALYGYGVDLVVANRVFPAGDDEWRAGLGARPAGPAHRDPRVVRRAAGARAHLPRRRTGRRAGAARGGRGPLRRRGSRPRSARRASCCASTPTARTSCCRHATAAGRAIRGGRGPGRRRPDRHRRRPPPGAHPAERAAALRRGRPATSTAPSCRVRFRPDPEIWPSEPPAGHGGGHG